MKRRPLIRPIQPPISGFAGFRFPPEAIRIAVRWYLRYGLSYRVGKPLKEGSQAVDALCATQEVLIVLDQGDWFDPAIRSSKTDSGLGSR